MLRTQLSHSHVEENLLEWRLESTGAKKLEFYLSKVISSKLNMVFFFFFFLELHPTSKHVDGTVGGPAELLIAALLNLSTSNTNLIFMLIFILYFRF